MLEGLFEEIVNLIFNYSRNSKEEMKIKRFLISLASLILLAASFVLLMAVVCDFFGVYIPGVTYLIPAKIQKQYYQSKTRKPEVPLYTRERVIIIEE